jgi:hypothetical protein
MFVCSYKNVDIKFRIINEHPTINSIREKLEVKQCISSDQME